MQGTLGPDGATRGEPVVEQGDVVVFPVGEAGGGVESGDRKDWGGVERWFGVGDHCGAGGKSHRRWEKAAKTGRGEGAGGVGGGGGEKGLFVFCVPRPLSVCAVVADGGKVGGGRGI